MNSRDDREQISAEIPSATNQALEAAKDQRGKPKWELINEALRVYLGLGTESDLAGLERRVQRLKEQRDALREKRDDVENELNDINTELSRARKELDRLKEKQASYTEKLDSILEKLSIENNKTVFAFREELRNMAVMEYGEATEDNISEVISDLKERVAEIDASVAEDQFEDTIQSHRPHTLQKRSQSRNRGLRITEGGDE